MHMLSLAFQLFTKAVVAVFMHRMFYWYSGLLWNGKQIAYEACMLPGMITQNQIKEGHCI